MKRRYPDAIGLGFRRCASSWLHRCMNEHPEIGKSERGVHFFSENVERGEDWYVQQLASFADRPVLVDFSVTYAYPEYIEQFVTRLHGLLEMPRLFAIVRNPVDRAFSDYRRSLFKGEYAEQLSFERAIAQYPILLERGRYGMLLRHVVDTIAEAELKILFYDDVQDQPAQLWDETCTFLGVSSAFVPTVLHTRLGHLAPPRHATLTGVLRSVNARVTRAPLVGGAWQRLKKTVLWRKMLQVNMQRVDDVHPATRKKLVDFYDADIEWVAGFTGRDLSHWRRYV